MEYGVIGEHLPHSFSKEIHALMADYNYEIQEISKDALDAFMKEKPFKAINVTIPYKQAVLPYLSHIDPKAETIHAVNTIVNHQGKLYGYNTDYYGLSSLIQQIDLSLQGKKVLILGTGGTSRTAYSVAKDAGAAAVYKVSRHPQFPEDISYRQAETEYNDAHIIINTTPCGMFPTWNDTPIELTVFSNLEGVIDAIYNPLRSKLILKAKALGIPAQGGLYMLVAQAAKAAEYFLNQPLPDNTVAKVFEQLTKQKENIVLIGMPGCGKTTIGKALADTLHRPFVDMDDEITQKIGCPIAEYFARHGEDAFRTIETQIACEVIAPMTGAVIATGGGAVVRDETITALKTNGRLYFIDRPLEQLCATKDRPTANSKDALQKRYEERYERYCGTCDVHIHSNGVVNCVVQQIKEDFSL